MYFLLYNVFLKVTKIDGHSIHIQKLFLPFVTQSIWNLTLVANPQKYRAIQKLGKNKDNAYVAYRLTVSFQFDEND